jgi:predicted acyl esterase
MTQVRAWFDCYLRSGACARVPGVAVAPEGSTQPAPWNTALPKTTTSTFTLPGVTTFARSGKAVRTTAPLRKPIEIFGSPTVKAAIGAGGGWSRLVAVLTARTPQGKEIVVSAGGVPTKNGARTVTIQLINQATFVPKGSRLTLTLASASTAQSTSNLLYLDLPMAANARVRVGTAVLKLPGLRSPVTK